VTKEIQFEEQLRKYAEQFNIENDLIHFLFLIGIHESGAGFRQFTKDEKTDLIDLGGATVLSHFGYYKEIETSGPVPYYVVNPEEKAPEGHQREILLKKGIIHYFSEKIEQQ